jgi:predicted RNase H-like nuclease (RuvC/YqgF family)
MVTVTLLFVAGVVLPSSASAEIYKWVDNDGVVHFSDTPPATTEVETLPETPVQTVGATQSSSSSARPSTSAATPTGHPIPRNRGHIADYQRHIQECNRQIIECTTRIQQLKRDLDDLRHRYTRHGAGTPYDRTRRQLTAQIDNYQHRIEEQRRLAREYSDEIARLRKNTASK